MRIFSRSLLSLTLFISVSAAASTPVNLPDFTPNVVDSAHVLTANEVAEINAAIESIRQRADILSAVYINEDLRGDSIENVSVQAFQKWKLGSKGKDNGLLLVIATKEHKSRFEVGYGLEGDLPDVFAKRTLDQVLKPELRAGNFKSGIIGALNRMADIKTKTPVGDNITAEPSAFARQLEQYGPAAGAYGFYLILLWSIGSITLRRKRKLAARLQPLSKFKKEPDPGLEGGSIRTVFVQVFMTLNPGLFILAGALSAVALAYVIIGAEVLFTFVFVYLKTKPYRNVANYNAYMLGLVQARSRQLQRAAHPEQYLGSDTNSYGSSFGSSSDSSSSSDSGSSSSDGGSSGGGGASSDW